jgi:hypothetical protein
MARPKRELKDESYLTRSQKKEKDLDIQINKQKFINKGNSYSIKPLKDIEVKHSEESHLTNEEETMYLGLIWNTRRDTLRTKCSINLHPNRRDCRDKSMEPVLI